MSRQRRLGEILVDLGVIDHADLDRVLAALERRHDHCKVGQVAREMGLISEEHILAALAVQMNLFPGIGLLTLQEILCSLLEPDLATPPETSRCRQSGGQCRGGLAPAHPPGQPVRSS